MEFGSLAALLRRRSDFAEPFIATVVRSVFRALHFLHDARRVHRDVSTAAVFVAADGRCKLGQLSLCVPLDNDSDNVDTCMCFARFYSYVCFQ